MRQLGQGASAAVRPNGLQRRQLLAGAALGGGAASVICHVPSLTSQSTAALPELSNRVSTTTDAVETNAGRIKGYRRNGIHTFKGVPYAAPPVGAARYLPPDKPRGWSGVRSTLAYGPVCPQAPRWRNDYLAFLYDWNEGYADEDCLRLNLWTPGLMDDGRRPVMVWLHGGGFYAGSSHELPSYDGENLSRRGDVVVVSINHRVGVLGYLNLADAADEPYADAANVGMLDIVAALTWVQDNIAAFGGDPGNVTLFGHSGGGWKISALMAIPAAHGLFHKVAVQSGSLLRLAMPEETGALAAALVRDLGLARGDFGRLRDLSAAQLVEAGVRARRKMTAGLPTTAKKPNWQPTVDGRVIPAHPFDPNAPALSKAVPMLIGSTLHEWNPAVAEPSLESLSLAPVADRLTPQFGDRTKDILQVYQSTHPRAAPIELLALILSARTDTVAQAERQAAAAQAPVFVYQFAWETPILDGRPRAFHGSDLPFIFDNTDRCASISMTGGGEGPRDLAARMSSAWAVFARTGNPGHPGLPDWPRFAAAGGATMVFDEPCTVANDPDRLERLAVASA